MYHRVRVRAQTCSVVNKIYSMVEECFDYMFCGINSKQGSVGIAICT